MKKFEVTFTRECTITVEAESEEVLDEALENIDTVDLDDEAGGWETDGLPFEWKDTYPNPPDASFEVKDGVRKDG